MTVRIKPFGMSEEEIAAIDKTGWQWRKSAKKVLLEMYHTPPPNEADISALEVAFGKLPSDYKEFLIEFNGGAPIPNTIVTKNNELVVNYFFAIKCPKNYSNGLYQNYDIYAERIPNGTLPIASSGGGDLILLKLGGTNDGKVYYWCHDLESESDSSNYWENIELIAGSFSELLNELCEVN